MTRLSAVINTPDPGFQGSVARLLRSLGASFSIIDERQAALVSPQIAVVDVRGGAAMAQPSLERMRASWPSAVIVAVAATEQPQEILHAMRGGDRGTSRGDRLCPGALGHLRRSGVPDIEQDERLARNVQRRE